jgi:3-carboxy-cis,cis-muconate cycloisomerase
MPQKSNPVISELIITAARTNASLLANMHQAMIQEHERATHGWQMEWLTLPQMMNLTAVSLSKARFLSEHIVINKEQMRNNVTASNGLMLAEALTFALAPAYMSRADAKQLVREACQTVLAENKHLVDVVQTQIDVPLDWAALRDEANYFGSADLFIDNVLAHISES